MLIAETDDMPLTLSSDDKKWVKEQFKDLADRITQSTDEQVRNAIESFKPLGWGKAFRALREVAPLGGICMVVLALLAIVVALGIGVVNRREVEATFRGKTEEKLNGIDRQLIDLRALVASSQPTRKQNQDAAKGLLAEARQKAIPPIPIPVIEQAGKSFIEAATVNPKAWDVALDFVGYRSSLNTPPDGQSIPAPPLKAETQYQLQTIVSKDAPEMYYLRGQMLPQSDAARAELLSIPLEQTAKTGIGTFIMRGGTLDLDGMHLRHVVLEGVEVYYFGKPIILQDVLFVNCRFVMENTPNGRTVGEEILSASRVNLTLGQPA